MPSPRPTPNPTLVDVFGEAEGVVVCAGWLTDDVATAATEVMKLWDVGLNEGIDEVEEETVVVVVEDLVRLK